MAAKAIEAVTVFCGHKAVFMLTKEQKKKLVAELAEAFKSSPHILFADFRGVDTASMNALRERLRRIASQFQVVKKTLLDKALKEAGIVDVDTKKLEGQIALAFGFEDPVLVAKELKAFSKIKETFSIIGGVLSGAVLQKTEAQTLASIPSRQELLAKLVGSLAFPIQGFVGTLHAVPRSFVGALSALTGK